MNRSDRNKLRFIRNWKLPGTVRLTKFISPSKEVIDNFKNGITWLSNEDIAIHTTADNYIEDYILKYGEYEVEINKLINISLKTGYIALDIGANIGVQSLRMSKCVGESGNVYAFEPLEYLQKKFLKNITLNNCSNVSLLPMALSDNDDTIGFTVNENPWNQGNFSLDSSASGSKEQMVVVKPGDDVSEIKQLSRLDLIKIDVEGYEFHVMRGLINTITKHRPRIIFEYDYNYWQRTRQKLEDCLLLLKALDYKIYQVTEVGCELLTDLKKINADNLFCLPV